MKRPCSGCGADLNQGQNHSVGCAEAHTTDSPLVMRQLPYTREEVQAAAGHFPPRLTFGAVLAAKRAK